MTNGAREQQQPTISLRYLIIIVMTIIGSVSTAIWVLRGLVDTQSNENIILKGEIKLLVERIDDLQGELFHHTTSPHPNPDYRELLRQQFNECFRQINELKNNRK